MNYENRIENVFPASHSNDSLFSSFSPINFFSSFFLFLANRLLQHPQIISAIPFAWKSDSVFVSNQATQMLIALLTSLHQHNPVEIPDFALFKHFNSFPVDLSIPIAFTSKSFEISFTVCALYHFFN